MSEGGVLGSKVRAGVEGRVGSFGQGVSSSPLLSTVLPQRPRDLHLVSSQPTELEVAWTPGLSGIYPLTHCTLQVRPQAFLTSVSALLPSTATGPHPLPGKPALPTHSCVEKQ